jgi:hypothetical protein
MNDGGGLDWREAGTAAARGTLRSEDGMDI